MGTRTSSTDSSTSSSTTGRTASQPPPPEAPRSTSTLTVLTPSDVKKILATLDPELALGAQAEAFKALSDPSEKVYLPHRHLLNYGDRYSLYMPSRYSAGEGIKIASQTQGSTALLDIETGKVKALVSAKGLTPWRNAAGEHPILAGSDPDSSVRLMHRFGAGCSMSSFRKAADQLVDLRFGWPGQCPCQAVSSSLSLNPRSQHCCSPPYTSSRNPCLDTQSRLSKDHLRTHRRSAAFGDR